MALLKDNETRTTVYVERGRISLRAVDGVEVMSKLVYPEHMCSQDAAAVLRAIFRELHAFPVRVYQDHLQFRLLGRNWLLTSIDWQKRSFQMLDVLHSCPYSYPIAHANEFIKRVLLDHVLLGDTDVNIELWKAANVIGKTK